MFSQIIAHTPVWVWALLSFLIYRGVMASRDRNVKLPAVVILPLVMLLLSLQGIVSGFGITLLTLTSWGTACILSAYFAWKSVSTHMVKIEVDQAQIFLRGSWAPMGLMLTIFIIKYAVNVMLSIQPQWQNEASFIAATCLIYGFLNGLLLGKMLRIIFMYKQSKPRASALIARSKLASQSQTGL
ncbi:hypothetical protein LPB67_13625 [Undibacterium sp. Jales W-56]|uniref:DUF6622 family protein n=1 Tax=Undibacterium sp. Jales W-56 TaxID=2897325 RepID=UPI0021CFF51D|nr:hypothetical protein [Undibacterium sp. Jales W-56]